MRHADTVYVFCDRYMQKKTQDQINWIDLRKDPGQILNYNIKYSETPHGKKIKGGLNIWINEDTYNVAKYEIKRIIQTDHNSDKKIFFINKFLANYVKRHKYAVSAGLQLSELSKYASKLVRKKIAATDGREILHKLYQFDDKSIDKNLYLPNTNPFFDIRLNEERYFFFFSPYSM